VFISGVLLLACADNGAGCVELRGVGPAVGPLCPRCHETTELISGGPVSEEAKATPADWKAMAFATLGVVLDRMPPEHVAIVQDFLNGVYADPEPVVKLSFATQGEECKHPGCRWEKIMGKEFLVCVECGYRREVGSAVAYQVKDKG